MTKYTYLKSGLNILTLVCLLFFGMRLSAQTTQSAPMMLNKTDDIQVIKLQSALDRALKQHVELNLQENSLAQKKAQKVSALARILPKLSGNMRYTRNIPEIKSSLAPSNAGQIDLYREMARLLENSNDKAGAQRLNDRADQMLRRPSGSDLVTKPKDVVDASLSLEIPIFNGPDFAKYLQVKDLISLEHARLTDQISKTISLTTKTYFSAVHKKDLVLLREQQIKLAQKTLAKILDQWNAGLIDSSDKLRAEYQASQAELALASARLDYDSEIAALGILIGQADDFDIDLPEEEIFAPTSKSPDELISIAIDNRPDLVAQKQAIKVASRDRLGGIFQFFPTISLKADAIYSSNTQGFSNQKVSYAIYLNAQYNFFSGLSRVGLLKEAALKAGAEEIKLTHLSRNIRAQIRGRVANLDRLKQEQANKNKMVLISTAEETKASDRYNLGLIDLSQLLEAQQNLFDAEISAKRYDALIKEEQIALVSDLGLLTPQWSRKSF